MVIKRHIIATLCNANPTPADFKQEIII